VKSIAVYFDMKEQNATNAGSNTAPILLGLTAPKIERLFEMKS